MQTRQLGLTGPDVSALGLGCMGMSEYYGTSGAQQSIAVIHQALDVHFSDDDLTQVNGIFPPNAAAGNRYNETGMRTLNR